MLSFFGNHRYSGINFHWIAFVIIVVVVVVVVGQFLNLLILKMLLINGIKIRVVCFVCRFNA